MDSGSPRFRIRQAKLGRYPYFGILFSATLALFAVGVFVSIIIYSKELERIVRQGISVQVYLQNHLSTDKLQALRHTIASKVYIAKGIPQEEAVEFISKDSAAQEFIRETGEDFQELLGENPLRNAFVVRIGEAYQDSEELARIKADMERLPGVFQATYMESTIQSINKNMAKVGFILLGIGLLLFVVVALLINNAVRLALFSQRFIIRSMQLVGATNWFIQRAFLYRALLNGLAAGVAAAALLYALVHALNRQVDGLALIYNEERIIILLGALALLGALVSTLSALRTVNKFLKLSSDELY